MKKKVKKVVAKSKTKKPIKKKLSSKKTTKKSPKKSTKKTSSKFVGENTLLKMNVSEAKKIFKDRVEYKHILPPSTFKFPDVNEFVNNLSFDEDGIIDDFGVVIIKNIFNPSIKSAIIDLLKEDQKCRDKYIDAITNMRFKLSQDEQH
jgi:hypothetical protein